MLVRSLSLKLPRGMRLDEHAHAWPQLVFAERGALAVSVADRQWVVPPSRMLWVPSDTPHVVETLGEVWMRTLYLSPRLAQRGALAPHSGICVFEVRPLLRELVLEASRTGVLVGSEPSHPHLAELIVDQLARARNLGLALPMPRDPRARRVAERARADLARTDTLAQLARDCGASARTIERVFLVETGLAFNQWRLQARLQHALRRLSESASVATVAGECGYASVSAFVSMFRLALSVTPGQYLREANANARASGQHTGG